MSEPRAVVLPFRPRPDLGALPVRPPSEDDALNAAWDHLLWLAIQAWSWRDLESLGAIEQAVSRLVRDVERDWS